MIKRLFFLESDSFDPYENLALEELLLESCGRDVCILYLWQNQKTVVIGRNQNAWAECRTEELKQAGGKLARRLSGGGAVFHDLGNLNFTFVVGKEDYHIPRQLEVILGALRRLGIPAEKSGRNDLLVEGKKFSGNAFYEQGDTWYHHGTLMVDVDKDSLTRYLTVSKEKLESKGVASVRSRVANLREFKPDLTVEELKNALVSALEEVYGLEAKRISKEDLDLNGLAEKQEKYASWDWLYGKRIQFQYQASKRFPWGGMELWFQVRGGRIRALKIYSDSLKPGLMEIIEDSLTGVCYNRNDLLAAMGEIPGSSREETTMLQDLEDWFGSMEL